MINVVCLIPARLGATRFPGKLMQILGSKTVIRHTYDNAVATNLFGDVIVVTDSEAIFNEITLHGGKAMMSTRQHESGSDRIAEAAAELDVDVIVNVQGDEPFVKKEVVEQMIDELKKEESVHVVSAMQILHEKSHIESVNYVKVTVDKNMNALYFSRNMIPSHFNKDMSPVYYEHIGLYAFRKQALLDFTAWPATPLENIEKVECLRYLENGVHIRMVITEYMGIEIDTPEDLVRASKLL